MSFWKNKQVLVTGAGGFVGSHLAEQLVREGAIVRAMVHYNALAQWGWLNHSDLAAQMEVTAGDITDRDSVRNAMEGKEVVFHLAALIAIPYSYRAPGSYIKTNIEGTMNVLQAARELKTSKIVHTSTSEVYGTARFVPISEAHPLQGQSPYSASKIGADKMAEAFHLSYGVPVTTVRPFNTFGPRQSARAVIPSIIAQCLKGQTVKLGSLTPTRDFNYVANTVSGFLKAGASEKSIGRTFNFGTGREISIGDLVQMISQLTGKPIDLHTEENRLRPGGSEVERLLADASAARETLDWTPEVSLEEGLTRTIEWIGQNQAKYRADIYNV